MRIPKICRYCGGKIIKSKSRVLYGKGNQTILHYHENRYVNKNLRRYTPDKQLEAEYKRQREQKEAEGGSEHE